MTETSTSLASWSLDVTSPLGHLRYPFCCTEGKRLPWRLKPVSFVEDKAKYVPGAPWASGGGSWRHRSRSLVVSCFCPPHVDRILGCPQSPRRPVRACCTKSAIPFTIEAETDEHAIVSRTTSRSSLPRRRAQRSHKSGRFHWVHLTGLLRWGSPSSICRDVHRISTQLGWA